MADEDLGRIFVVDDDEAVGRALSRLLRSFGYAADAFHSAAQVMAQPLPADLVCLVVDLRMPGEGGLELWEQLQAAGQDLPVVFVTAHGASGLAHRALQVAPVLQKPVDGGALTQAIRSVARRPVRAARR
ncbi:MAG: response regulator [Anaeromyxobacter sp.]